MPVPQAHRAARHGRAAAAPAPPRRPLRTSCPPRRAPAARGPRPRAGRPPERSASTDSATSPRSERATRRAQPGRARSPRRRARPRGRPRASGGRPHRPRPGPRSRPARGARRGVPALPAPSPPGQEAMRGSDVPGALRRRRSSHSRRPIALASSLEQLAKASQAPGDAAGDRPRREIEGLADGLVALVAREEAVKDLAAVLRRGGERLVDRQRLVEQGERLLAAGEQLLVGDGALARAGPQPVDAEPARQLGEPGAEGGVVPELVQVLVRTREDLLEDVLGVRLRQPEGLHGDGVDVAREALDQLVPRLLIACPAAGDELAVTQRRRHYPDCDWCRPRGETAMSEGLSLDMSAPDELATPPAAGWRCRRAASTTTRLRGGRSSPAAGRRTWRGRSRGWRAAPRARHRLSRAARAAARGPRT